MEVIVTKIPGSYRLIVDMLCERNNHSIYWKNSKKHEAKDLQKLHCSTWSWKSFNLQCIETLWEQESRNSGFDEEGGLMQFEKRDRNHYDLDVHADIYTPSFPSDVECWRKPDRKVKTLCFQRLDKNVVMQILVTIYASIGPSISTAYKDQFLRECIMDWFSAKWNNGLIGSRARTSNMFASKWLYLNPSGIFFIKLFLVKSLQWKTICQQRSYYIFLFIGMDTFSVTLYEFLFGWTSWFIDYVLQKVLHAIKLFEWCSAEVSIIYLGTGHYPG